MKIGMLTGIWSIAERASLIDSLRRAAALGFQYVDLHGVFHAGPVHLSTEDRLVVKSELKTLELIPRNYVLHPPHNLASAREAELELNFAYLQEGIDLALDWGINQLELNAGQWVYGLPKDSSWEKAVRFLQRLCDHASTRSFFIAIESEPYVWFLVNDLASTQRMLSDVNRPNFTVLVDLGHLALERQSPKGLAQIADVIINAHFSDHKPYLHTNQVIGTGFTPTADYLDMLRQLEIDRRMQRFGYDEMVVSFELGVPGDRIDDPDDWVRKSLQHVLEIAPYMNVA
jgi:sugar phosphate isomerase/epimerase